jgi:hypothetical protein
MNDIIHPWVELELKLALLQGGGGSGRRLSRSLNN